VALSVAARRVLCCAGVGTPPDYANCDYLNALFLLDVVFSAASRLSGSRGVRSPSSLIGLSLPKTAKNGFMEEHAYLPITITVHNVPALI